jgi:FKBP-type peptidyl-prolyl cis-trans isomerase FkpA
VRYTGFLVLKRRSLFVSVKEHGQRVVILALVVAFVLSSVSFSGLVIWQLVKDKNKNSSTADIQKQLQDQLNQQNNANQKKENSLEGTELQGFTPVQKVDSLQKIDTKEGTGEEVKPGATVTAHYTGAIAASGIIFQSSHDGQNQPIPFSLSSVIKGWTDGVPGMKVGGTRRLLIPAAEAYGENPPAGSNIPPNADLVFDIELVSVQQ